MNKRLYFTGKFFTQIIFILSVAFIFKSTEILAQPNLILVNTGITGLSQPIQFVNAGDGTNRTFIVQKEGVIKVYSPTFSYLGDFLTVSGINTAGEQGLLSMAFHPNYENNGYFFVFYTTNTGNLQISRYKVSAGNINVADAASKDTVITISHPNNSNHNGGELHFGADGMLYLSTGDGGGGGDVPNNAQNTAILLGKILRLNVSTSENPPYYTIPAGNPYNNEVYCTGLRNPYRWSFDRMTNDIWIGDVGQDKWEEFSYMQANRIAGTNFGWRCYEGDEAFNTSGCLAASNYTFPVHDYTAAGATTSVTGGVVYRGNDFPAMKGWYFGCDFYTNTFYKIRPDGIGGWSVMTQSLTPNNIVDFGETESGEVYVVSLGGGSVWRLTTNTVLPISLQSFTARVESGGVMLNWTTKVEEDMSHFEIEYSMDGKNFIGIHEMGVENLLAGSNYNFFHDIKYDGKLYYRLIMVDQQRSESFSNIENVVLSSAPGVTINPSLINTGNMVVNIKNGVNYNSVEIFDMSGKLIYNEDISGKSGEINISLVAMEKGMFFVRFNGNAPSELHKIIIQ